MVQHNAMGMNPQMGGGYYNFTGVPTQVQPKIMNTLTDDEIKILQSGQSQFSLGLTQKEMLQGACNHRLPDGTGDSLVFDPYSGVARCTICGYEFRPIDADTSLDDITEAKDKIIDILQTIKLLYTDLPSDAAREYFQIIPLLMKVPQLFEFAAKNFAKHEMNAWQYTNQNMSGISLLANLGNILGAGQMPVYGGAAPQMQRPYVAPQQPVMNPGFAAGYPNAAYQAPVTPGVNPFGYAGASQPVNPGYAYQPGQVTPVAPTVAAPAAPAAPAPATSTETVTTEVQV